MDNPAQIDDLTVDRGYTGDLTVAGTRLDEAWRGLRRERFATGGLVGPSLDAQLASGDLSIDVVIDVVCSAALRVLRNPDGAEQESGGIDDYNESRTLVDASSDLYFTAAELRRLQSADDPYVGGFAGSVKYC